MLIYINYLAINGAKIFVETNFSKCKYCGNGHARYFIKCTRCEYHEEITDDYDHTTITPSYYAYTHRGFSQCDSCSKELGNIEGFYNLYFTLNQGEIGELTKEQFINSIKVMKKGVKINMSFFRFIGWSCIVISIIFYFLFYS